MPKEAKKTLVKKTLAIDPRKVKELRRLLKTGTEDEAVRMAIEESVIDHRVTRSLTRFLDTLAKEQPHA